MIPSINERNSKKLINASRIELRHTYKYVMLTLEITDSIKNIEKQY